MKPQAKKNNVNFTFILPAFVHKTSDFLLYQNLGGNALIFLIKYTIPGLFRPADCSGI